MAIVRKKVPYVEPRDSGHNIYIGYDEDADINYMYKKCMMILKTIECILFTVTAVAGIIIACMMVKYVGEDQHPTWIKYECPDYGTVKMEDK